MRPKTLRHSHLLHLNCSDNKLEDWDSSGEVEFRQKLKH
jgi:hypothetical protein